MPTTIDDLITAKRGQINSKVLLHNDCASELDKLRSQDTPDEAKVTELREQKARLGADIDTLQREFEDLESEKRVDEKVDKLQRETTDTNVVVREREEQVRVVSEPNPVYRKNDASQSYFRDLYGATQGSQESIRRLTDSQVRAGGTTVNNAGGEFAPPIWLVDDFIAQARGDRVTANLFESDPLPENQGSSLNWPGITSGNDVAVTQTQNTTITETALVTTSVSSIIQEISGKTTVSIALMKQAAYPIDKVILQDLSSAYAALLDLMVLSGSNSAGQIAGLVTSGTTVTYTTTQPTQASTSTTDSFYSKLNGALAGMATQTKAQANAVVMHPRRWFWLANALDGSGRPLVIPAGQASNALIVNGAPVAEGFAGTTAHGLPVYLDANVPTTIGAATNQDYVFALNTREGRLAESSLETASFDATLAAQNSILFRVLGFAAFALRRKGAAQVISGTGLVAPAF